MSLATANPDGLPDILPIPSSLRAAAQMAHARREPMIVLVTLKGCAFCDVVRTHYLGPMFKKGEVFAVQVNMLDRKTTLQDLQGNSTTPYDQARAWKARVAPTLLFLDIDGKELAERLEGMTAADFYGAYLDERIQTARQKIRSR
jgi:thioredoxin-related protein